LRRIGKLWRETRRKSKNERRETTATEDYTFDVDESFIERYNNSFDNETISLPGSVCSDSDSIIIVYDSESDDEAETNPVPQTAEELFVMDNNDSGKDSEGSDNSDLFEIIDENDENSVEEKESLSLSRRSSHGSPSSHSRLSQPQSSHSRPSSYSRSNRNNLPSSREISKELCKIVYGCPHNPYSPFRRSALMALSKVLGWVENRDPVFLQNFITYGGVVKILDFLQDILDEEKNHKGYGKKSPNDETEDEFRYRITVESIHIAASVISGVCSTDGDTNNIGNDSTATTCRQLATVTSKVVVNHGGIETLLMASDLCNCCEDQKHSAFDSEASLVASEGIWTAIANACSAADDETATRIVDDLSISVWDVGLEAMERFGSNSGIASPDTARTAILLRASVFRSFERILFRRRGDMLVTKNIFVEKRILSRSLEIVSSAYPRDENSAQGNHYIHSGIRNNINCSIHSSIHSGSLNSSIHSSIHSSIDSQSIKIEPTGTPEEEALLEEALSFFYECHHQNVLFKTADVPTRRSGSGKSIRPSDTKWTLCKGLIPVCVMALLKFGADNSMIRRIALRMLDASLDNCGGSSSKSKNNNDGCKKKNDHHRQNCLDDLIEGAIEALSMCLTSDRVDETELVEIRGLMRKVVWI